jgi:hypothetical protein
MLKKIFILPLIVFSVGLSQANAFDSYVWLSHKETGHNILLLGEHHNDGSGKRHAEMLYNRGIQIGKTYQRPSNWHFEFNPRSLDTLNAKEIEAGLQLQTSETYLFLYEQMEKHPTTAFNRLLPFDPREKLFSWINGHLGLLENVVQTVEADLLENGAMPFSETDGMRFLQDQQGLLSLELLQHFRELHAPSVKDTKVGIQDLKGRAQELFQRYPLDSLQSRCFEKYQLQIEASSERILKTFKKAGTGDEELLFEMMVRYLGSSKNLEELKERDQQLARDLVDAQWIAFSDMVFLEKLIEDQHANVTSVMMNGMLHTQNLSASLQEMGYAVESQKFPEIVQEDDGTESVISDFRIIHSITAILDKLYR